MIESCGAFVIIPLVCLTATISIVIGESMNAVVEISDTGYQQLVQKSKFETPEMQHAIKVRMADSKITIAEYEDIKSMADAIEKQTNKQNLIKKLQENHQ